MRRALLFASLVAVVTSAIWLSAGAAFATPSRTGVCSSCHTGVNVPVSAALVSANGSSATYSFDAPTAESVAVFDGAAKVGSSINYSTGQFTVTAGKTYTVYAVKGPGTNSGIGSTSVSPAAPDVTAPSTTSDAVAAYVGRATINLTAIDYVGGSGVAATYHRLDGGPQTAGTKVEVATPGAHTLEFWSVDVAGNVELHKNVAFSISEVTAYVHVAGADRFMTAIEASKRAYPSGLDVAGPRTVVIATGRNWPDALGGTSLAGALDGPVLLVDTLAVPGEVLAEANRLGATKAIILGGTSAVGAPVEEVLKDTFGAANVERIAGTNRYATADEVAKRVIALLGASYDGTAFVATGANFPDALAAAPLAAAKSWPLFLAHPTGGLAPATVAAMDGVDNVVVLGGTGVVAPSVEAGLEDAYGAANVIRLAGANRYATAVAVATYAVNSGGLSWDGVGITTGEKSPDALAGGVLQGKAGSVMLLTRSESLETPTRDALVAHKAEISSVVYFGGPGALGQATRDAIAAALE